jgi:hypothetical protein
MTFKHTPGPWYTAPTACDRLSLIATEPDGKHVGIVTSENASLIAAAPDLLAALQAIRDAGSYDDADNFVIPPGEWDGKYDPPDTSDHPAIVAMYVALHKATGG